MSSAAPPDDWFLAFQRWWSIRGALSMEDKEIERRAFEAGWAAHQDEMNQQAMARD